MFGVQFPERFARISSTIRTKRVLCALENRTLSTTDREIDQLGTPTGKRWSVYTTFPTSSCNSEPHRVGVQHRYIMYNVIT